MSLSLWNRTRENTPESPVAPDPAQPVDVAAVFVPDPTSEPLTTAEALAMTSTSSMPARPETPVAPVATPAATPDDSRPSLPSRTPGEAPAIAQSAITGAAISRAQEQPPAPSAAPVTAAVALQPADEHPLTSTDLTYRYPKEQATGFNRGLRNAYAKGALSDLSDTDLGLVTVPVADLYATLVADMGYDPLG